MIQRVVEPGLPNWPPLFIDSANGTCFISTRISDWRSVEQANAMSRLLIAASYIATAWCIFKVVPPYHDQLYRWLMVCGWFAPFALLVFPLLRSSLPTLLSKTLFSRRLNLIFAPTAIGLQSHLYRRSLKLRRLISGRAVVVQFLLGEDSEAKSEAHATPKLGEKLNHGTTCTMLASLKCSFDQPTNRQRENRRVRLEDFDRFQLLALEENGASG